MQLKIYYKISFEGWQKYLVKTPMCILYKPPQKTIKRNIDFCLKGSHQIHKQKQKKKERKIERIVRNIKKNK